MSSLLLLLASSCRTMPEQVVRTDDPKARALLADWLARAESRTGLRGRSTLAVDSADGRIASRGKLVLVVERPARLRVEVLGFLNQALAVVVTDGDRFEVLRSSDHSYQSGDVGPTLLWDEARIALTAEEAIAVLLGIPVPNATWTPSRISTDSRGRTSIELADSEDTPRQRLSFDSSGHLEEAVLLDGAGEPVWRARFDKYREIAGNWLAHEIELDVTIGQTHAEITLRDIELNPVLSDDIFQLGVAGRAPASGPSGGEG